MSGGERERLRRPLALDPELFIGYTSVNKYKKGVPFLKPADGY
jgi:hypothetical protein